ncbi:MULTISPECIES: SDR family NAD(P)-dependent oxidoreductase [Mycobacterium]|uniref:Short-chain dehydrogenase n=2 Tax=Mycobacterium avium complex (MAC) TaxID=120793 RepID=A0ABM7KAM8_9MYCO|nr:MULTISPECIES: SDR family NAD(P)-dependent oxidoreductase [Mycobacterium]AFC48043.1 short chain dehydrogenase [Mycobacterium intracellulare MOTT-02]AFC52960.1 short chain dehydrogenase [Mycobacterium paraintracellulare]AFS13587.1 Retinol dehydrogenase 14 [Mycobacterium intracellulare subsp. intracellulare MTCC 9506]ASW94772.1 short-chain dehydrogenase [Mycobacterium intracellulare]ETZ37485.1 short chain dehydrogenase family protein [Mycobacterium intracellulare MIN_061107_1834]
MTRRTIVITGASDGIGAAAARRLCRTGDQIVVVGRTPTKTAAVAAELDADHFVVDYADLSQVRALAGKIRSQHPRIDVLLNNAGRMASKIELTPDGYERTYQVNYLAPFLLTTQLLDVLLESRATIVNTSSSSQRLLRNVKLADFDTTARRRPSTAYAVAKLANILFTKELDRRYRADGLSVAVVHPGFVNTNIGHSSGSRFLTTMQRTPVSRMIKSADDGADQLVWLATSVPGVDWAVGEYYAKGKVAKANRAAYDPILARELWDHTLANLSWRHPFDTQ